MTTLSDQVGQLMDLAADRVGQTPDPWAAQAIVEAAAAAWDAWRDDGAVSGPWGSASCQAWGAASAGVLGRTNYRLLCGPWEDQVRGRLGALGQALIDAGHADVAEVAGSIGDQVATMGEQAAIVTTPQAADTPIALRVALGLLIAAVLARIAGVLR